MNETITKKKGNFLESRNVYLNYLNMDSNPLTPFSLVGSTTNGVALGYTHNHSG